MADTKKTAEEIKKTVAEKQEKLRVLRFDLTGAKSKNVKEARELKREIARLKTSLSMNA